MWIKLLTTCGILITILAIFMLFTAEEYRNVSMAIFYFLCILAIITSISWIWSMKYNCDCGWLAYPHEIKRTTNMREI